MINLEKYMQEAIYEAIISLREGNHGFGAVIVKDNEIISKAHDLEETNRDPTSHAEVNAIRLATMIIGKNLNGCILLSTHEPCPMCSTAIIWSGINHLAYGYSISESIKQGCKRINLPCEELFTNLLDSAYNLLLCRFNIDSSEAQIIDRTNHRIVFHSKNFCPTLEACKILNYDTRYICKYYNENSTNVLIKQIDHRLKFDRNYDKLRPYSDYCEEIIILEKDEINCI
jgi:tRNA(Arg) A34 adenosine deaminase TadA